MEIVILIDDDGNTEIEVKGGDGKKCVALTAELEEILGKVENKIFKPEFQQNARISNTHQLKHSL